MTQIVSQRSFNTIKEQNKNPTHNQNPFSMLKRYSEKEHTIYDAAHTKQTTRTTMTLYGYLQNFAIQMLFTNTMLTNHTPKFKTYGNTRS